MKKATLRNTAASRPCVLCNKVWDAHVPQRHVGTYFYRRRPSNTRTATHPTQEPSGHTGRHPAAEPKNACDWQSHGNLSRNTDTAAYPSGTRETKSPPTKCSRTYTKSRPAARQHGNSNAVIIKKKQQDIRVFPYPGNNFELICYPHRQK